MSNLYKQWFVQTDSANTRIIDSNVILQQHLKQDLPQTPAQNVQEEEGGFSAGLVTGDPGQVIKAEPQIDYEAEAKAKAEEILAAAQQNADAILAQANEDAEEIRTSAKTQGYEEGRASAEQENEQLRVQLEESYRKKQGDLDSDYRDKREHMEQDLVDVIVTVFEKVFHIQFDDKKEILMHLVEDAVLNIEDDKRFRVKVAEDNALFLENHKNEILDRVGHDIELEIVSDATVEGNDCTIETDSGVFNCSLGTQLENLIKDIRSLCS